MCGCNDEVSVTRYQGASGVKSNTGCKSCSDELGATFERRVLDVDIETCSICSGGVKVIDCDEKPVGY
jgi:hypothetical protein